MKSNELAKELSKCGATFLPYSKTPPQARNGALSLLLRRETNDVIKVYCRDGVKISIHIDKKHKQALIQTDEKAEVIDHTESQTFGTAWSTDEINKWFKDLSNLNTIRVPGTKIKIIKLNIENKTDFLKGTATLKLHIPARKTILLAGIDESAHFICMLPETAKVSTVEQAHKFLRPKGLSNKAVRQGEFFFDPLSDKQILDLFTNKIFIKDALIDGQVNLERNSTHIANIGFYNNDDYYKQNPKMPVYVMGKIFCTRKGTHKYLILKRWHKLVRNNEVKQQNTIYLD